MSSITDHQSVRIAAAPDVFAAGPSADQRSTSFKRPRVRRKIYMKIK